MNRTATTILLLVTAVVLLGCSRGLDNGSLSPLSFIDIKSLQTPDTAAPTVAAWNPQGEGVNVSSRPTVRFSEVMNTATINSSTFLVTGGGVAVPGRVSYNILTKTYTFTPDSPLANLVAYTVTILGTVTDKAGNALGTDFSWTFSTHDMNTLPAPDFDPPGGTHDAGTVKITYTGPVATIYYTTNMTDPSPSNGTRWEGVPIPITENTQIRAIACENPGYYDSPVATADFYVHTEQPSFSHTDGTQHGDFDLEIFPSALDPDSYVYYEMTVGTAAAPPPDPADPTTASTPYTGPIPIAGDYTVVKIKTIAAKSGKCDSIPVFMTYTIDYYQAGTPTFSPDAGTYDIPQSVFISHDPGSTVYYTTDGSDPKTYGIEYDDGPIDVSESTVYPIRAYAVMDGYRDSAEATASYIINPEIASVIPNAGSKSETNLAVTINGARFRAGGSAALTYGASRIEPTSSVYVNENTVTCLFDLSSATAGYWSVTFTNPDTGTATLVDGFRVYAEPSGIVSWWKLDGNADDSTGPNDGTNSGGVSYTADRFGASGKAAVCSTGSDYISASTLGLPTGSSSRTMMGWFRIDSMHTGENFLFGYGSGTKFFKLSVTSVGNRLVFSDDGTDLITGNTMLQAGRWYHAAATYDGTTATLYLDGAVEGGAMATFATSAAGMYLFKVDGQFPYLNGALDDVMVLNTAMDQAGIQAVAANGGYLLPPTGLAASKTFWSQISVIWDPVLDATGYDVYRETSLLGAFDTPINATTITGTTYTDTDITAGVLYYYKVRAKNAAMTSFPTKAEVGCTYDTITTLTESFEVSGTAPAGFADWWTTSPTQPVTAGSTAAVSENSTEVRTGYRRLFVSSPTSGCSNGCGFTESASLTVTFGTPVSYFNLSMYYMYTAGTGSGGKFSVYINNPDPSDDPANGLVPFLQPLNESTYFQQRGLNYIGNNDVNSITIIFYDITNTTTFHAEDIVIKYK